MTAEKQDSYIYGQWPEQSRACHYVLRPAEMKVVLDILLETRYERRGREVGSMNSSLGNHLSRTLVKMKRQFLKRSYTVRALDTKEEDLTCDHPERAPGILRGLRKGGRNLRTICGINFDGYKRTLAENT